VLATGCANKFTLADLEANTRLKRKIDEELRRQQAARRRQSAVDVDA
jgi:hypothetical protein